MVRLSIVIATKDRHERLRKCLTAISNQTKRPYEIMIVDGSAKPYRGLKALTRRNSSRNSSGTGGFSVENHPRKGIHVIYRNQKSSMVEARNIGIRHVTGDVVLFLDDDAFIEKEYIEKLLEFYRSHPEAGGAEGRIVNEKAPRLLDRLLNFPTFPERDDLMRVWRLHGCNMSFRREVFRDFMFDERLIGYYNDDDEFCGRVSKKYKMFFIPSARLIHDQTQYGGARIDHYTNYNTLVFNQFYSLTTIQRKNIFDVFGYLLSQIIMIVRAFMFIKVDKHTAIKGIARGYQRVLYAIMKNNVVEQIRRL